MRRIVSVVVAGVAVLSAACTTESSSRARPEPPPTTPSGEATSTPSETSAGATPTPTPTTPTTTPTSGPREPAFSPARATRTVRFLAGDIGPRLATGPPFREAAQWVAGRLRDLGYDVSRQTFPVPAGDSWGIPVEAGTSANVVARPKGFDRGAPYLLVGAHLDTVAVSPGAEDNASGIAVLLETARRITVSPAPLPVVFVAFGGEEPRGLGDDDHHYGSRHYVTQMSATQRRNLRGMVSLDRVGVGAKVLVWSVTSTAVAVRAALVRSAARLGIDTVVGTSSASDHESFADAGMPAARLGRSPYVAYHKATDVPSVVNPDQLRRVGRVIWDWLLRAR
jgi:hypothetical protein